VIPPFEKVEGIAYRALPVAAQLMRYQFVVSCETEGHVADLSSAKLEGHSSRGPVLNVLMQRTPLIWMS